MAQMPDFLPDPAGGGALPQDAIRCPSRIMVSSKVPTVSPKGAHGCGGAVSGLQMQRVLGRQPGRELDGFRPPYVRADEMSVL